MSNPLQSALLKVMERGVNAIGAFNRKRLPAASPYAVGIHAPMHTELTLHDLPVTGTIPATLQGRYLRIGANPAQDSLAGHHWFLGDGMVHGLSIQDGRAVWYRNRWILSNAAAAALHRPAAPGPRRGMSDTVNTNVVSIAGRTFAVVEAGSPPVELSETLEAQRYNPFDGTLHGSFTGHPHRDPETGDHHAIAYDGRIWNQVRHVVVSAGGRVVQDTPIPVRHGPSIHDCAITARYAIILDLPVTFSMRTLLRGYQFPYRWNPSHPARVGLVPRGADPSGVIWCPVDPCYVFHIANAYDTPENQVILDVIAYPTMFASGPTDLDAVNRLERWIIDPASRTVRRTVLDPTPQEFPRIDERRFGRPYRYAYTAAVPPDGDPQLTGATTLYKHDLDSHTRQTHDLGDGHVPGEFVFVPAHADSAEDEGWLIGLVIDTGRDTTTLQILDARSFEAPPIATIHLPHRVPPGFHGNWFPADTAASPTGAAA